MEKMGPLAWSAALYCIFFGLLVAGLAFADICLIRAGHLSITRWLQGQALHYQWIPVVSTALITASVVLLLGLVLGHLWLQ